MGFIWTLIGLAGALVIAGLVFRSTPGRREYLVFAFVARIGLPLTEYVHQRIDRRIWDRLRGSAVGALVALTIYALVLGLWPEFWPVGLAGATINGLLAAFVGVGGAVPAMRQFIALAPATPRIARAHAPTLPDYVHPGWVVAAFGLTVVDAGISTALLLGLIPGTTRGGLPLPAVAALAVLAAAGVVAAAGLTAFFLSVPQPASSELELQWDDALRAYALRDLWIAAIALSTAACVAGLSSLVDETSPLTYAGLVIGLSPLFLMQVRPSRRFRSRLWQPSAALRPSRC